MSATMGVTLLYLFIAGGITHILTVWFFDWTQKSWWEGNQAALRRLGEPQWTAAGPGSAHGGGAAGAQGASGTAPGTAGAPATVDGQEVYVRICQACHQANGQGLPGAFPPLGGSEYVLKDPRAIIGIVLAGVQGEIKVKGEAYNSVMPGFPNLTDAEIAAVVSYVRGNFGNTASPVNAAAVRATREALGSRGPWTAQELEEIP